MLELETGVVKRYHSDKGFGFLSVIDEHGAKTGEDIFFHHNDGVFVELNEAGDDIDWAGDRSPRNGTISIHYACGFPKTGGHLEGKKLSFVRGPGHREGETRATKWTSGELYRSLRREIEGSGLSATRELIAG